LEEQKNGIGRIRYNAAINSAIKTRHKTLIHEMIDDKKHDGYTFGAERRKSKTGKNYCYLYRQKRNVNGKAREHVSLKAKDLNDYRENVLLNQAKLEVLKDLGGWGEEGLTRSEKKTFHTLTAECLKRKDDRNPVAERYIKELGMKVKSRKRGLIASRGMTIEKQKNILKAAKKGLDKWDKSYEKLKMIIDLALNGDYSSTEFEEFIKNVIRESACRNSVKKLQAYINQHIARNSNGHYSKLKPPEVKWVAEIILWISRKLKVPF
jgi:hypothetical protein